MQTKDSEIRLTFADAEPQSPARPFKLEPRAQHSGLHCVFCDVEKLDDVHWFQVMADDTVLIVSPLIGNEVSEGFQPVCGEGHYDRLKAQWFAHRHSNGKNGRQRLVAEFQLDDRH